MPTSPFAAKHYASESHGRRPLRIPMPTRTEVEAAQAEFKRVERRDLHYRAARELIRLQDAGLTSITLPEALTILLQSWNKTYYRFRRFDYDGLDALWSEWQKRFEPFRKREIASYTPTDEAEIEAMFAAFSDVLGPVGAAKSLHLLAPRFFPIWDDRIAKAYRLNNQGSRAEDYTTFMLVCKTQAQNAKLDPSIALKALDEFIYVVYTLPEVGPQSALPREQADIS